VQVAATELGLGFDRSLTVTGGMSFAGGPWNNYVMHAIATTVGLLREHSDAKGLCTANGGYLTKHSFGVYAAQPPESGCFQHEELQAEVDALPTREVDPDYEGPVTVEAYTVMHDRDGAPESAPVAAITPAGQRVWGSCRDADAFAVMLTEEVVGRSAQRAADGGITLTG
jgi:acetyl-CoA C-acetyltransferase